MYGFRDCDRTNVVSPSLSLSPSLWLFFWNCVSHYPGGWPPIDLFVVAWILLEQRSTSSLVDSTSGLQHPRHLTSSDLLGLVFLATIKTLQRSRKSPCYSLLFGELVEPPLQLSPHTVCIGVFFLITISGVRIQSAQFFLSAIVHIQLSETRTMRVSKATLDVVSFLSRFESTCRSALDFVPRIMRLRLMIYPPEECQRCQGMLYIQGELTTLYPLFNDIKENKRPRHLRVPRSRHCISIGPWRPLPNCDSCVGCSPSPIIYAYIAPPMLVATQYPWNQPVGKTCSVAGGWNSVKDMLCSKHTWQQKIPPREKPTVRRWCSSSKWYLLVHCHLFHVRLHNSHSQPPKINAWLLMWQTQWETIPPFIQFTHFRI